MTHGRSMTTHHSSSLITDLCIDETDAFQAIDLVACTVQFRTHHGVFHFGFDQHVEDHLRVLSFVCLAREN